MNTLQLETDGDQDLAETSTMKLKIPKRQHVKLRSMKLLTGQDLSTTVEEALSRYFEEEDVVEVSGS